MSQQFSQNEKMNQQFFKITYHMSGKRINAYLNMPSPTFYVLMKDIEMCLFDERKYPRCAIRAFWIDEDQDEIEIINQCDYDIFMAKRSERPHLQVAPVGMTVEEPNTKSATSNKTKVPPAAGSYDFAVHDHVECDSCLMSPIIGFRYKCIQCPNYDLCQNCESKHIHSEHMMVRMPTNNCPSVVEAYVTGRASGRRHGKRSKTSCPFVRNGLSVVIDDDAESPNSAGGDNAEQSSPTNGKERHHGRKHHRRHNRNNFFSNLYEMMNDLAEGGGAAAAAHAMGTSSTTTSGPHITTSTTFTANNENPQAAAAAATAAEMAAKQAHETAAKAAEIAAKVAHETASKAAKNFAENITASGIAAKVAHETASGIAAKIAHETASKAAKNFAENLTASVPKPTASASTSTASADGDGDKKEKETTKEKVDATTSPRDSESQPNSVPVIPSPSLEGFAQLLDPQYVKTGIQILNNFSDMFAKILDPMENFEGGQNHSHSNSQKSSETSNKSSASSNLNSLGSEKKSDEENSMENNQSQEKAKEKDSGSNSSQIDICDLGSDSENESVTDSFVKLYAPEKIKSSTTNSTKLTTSAASAQTTPPQSLDKSEVMDFAQLSANLKAHIAQEALETAPKSVDNSTTKVSTATATEPIATMTTSTSTAFKNHEEEKRAVPVYHADKRINKAVHAMMSMGFSNEGAWLTQLLESVNGNIAEALDLMTAAQRDGSR